MVVDYKFLRVGAPEYFNSIQVKGYFPKFVWKGLLFEYHVESSYLFSIINMWYRSSNLYENAKLFDFLQKFIKI